MSKTGTRLIGPTQKIDKLPQREDQDRRPQDTQTAGTIDADNVEAWRGLAVRIG